METRTISTSMVLPEPLPVKKVIEYMQNHYSYIYLDMSEKQIATWLNQRYIRGLSLLQTADLLADKLLASGSYVQE